MVRLVTKYQVPNMRARWNLNDDNFNTRPFLQIRSKTLEMSTETKWIYPRLSSAVDQKCAMMFIRSAWSDADGTIDWRSPIRTSRSREGCNRSELTVSKTFESLEKVYMVWDRKIWLHFPMGGGGSTLIEGRGLPGNIALWSSALKSNSQMALVIKPRQSLYYF